VNDVGMQRAVICGSTRGRSGRGGRGSGDGSSRRAPLRTWLGHRFRKTAKDVGASAKIRAKTSENGPAQASGTAPRTGLPKPLPATPAHRPPTP
jgi:hypothetical protein